MKKHARVISSGAVYRVVVADHHSWEVGCHGCQQAFVCSLWQEWWHTRPWSGR
jgi:hypothetical protein